jgi:hypothetical protein
MAHQKACRRRRPRETAESLLDELAASNRAAVDTSTDAKLKMKQMVDSVALRALGRIPFTFVFIFYFHVCVNFIV